MTWLGRATGLLVAVGPWLGLIPLANPLARVALASVVLAGAFHGLGRVVARVARHPSGVTLSIQFGLALALAAQGLALSLRSAGRSEAYVLLAIGLTVHTADTFHRRMAWQQWIDARARAEGTLASVLPWLALTALGALMLLGTAGDVGARPFDDDGNHLAQIARMLQTGALDDAVGFPRVNQLGGQLTLAGLGAALVGDVPGVRWLDSGLCFVLALGLVLSRLGPRSETRTTWTLLLLATLAALAIVPADPAAWWSAVGLMLALHGYRQAEVPCRSVLPVALLAGALATLRIEFIPVALVAVVARMARRGTARHVLGRVALGVVTLALVIGPYLAARAHAWAHLEGVARQIAPSPGRFTLIVFALGLAATGVVMARRTTGEGRWPALATLAGVVGITAQLAGSRPYATRFLWPILIAFALVVVIEVARHARLGAFGMIIALLASVLIHEGRDVAGRTRWSRRWTLLVDNIASLAHGAPRPPADYDSLLRRVPAGARVAVWVGRPERLDYTRHALFDLRSPRTTRLRSHHWAPHPSALAHMIETLGADYLLLEDDHASLRRRQRDLLARMWCGKPRPGCADDLEQIADSHSEQGRMDAVRLIRLR